MQLGKLAATLKAFAWHDHGGEFGADSSQVQEQMRNMQHIQATDRVFAAMLASGAVVTCGDPGYGGDSSQVQEQLRNVQHIQATYFALLPFFNVGLL